MRYLLVILFSLMGLSASAQFVRPITTPVWNTRLKVGPLFVLDPSDTSDVDATDHPGAVLFKKSDSTLYYSDGQHWEKVGTGSINSDSSLFVPRKPIDYTPSKPEIVSQVAPDSLTFDIILEAGQSNISGRNGDVDNPDYPFNSTVGNATWSQSEDDTVTLNTIRGGAEGGSFDNYFGDKYYSLTGNRVITMDASSGGAGISSLSGATTGNDWGATGTLRARMLQYYDSLKSATGLSSVKAIIWGQGERDAQQMDSNPAYTLSMYRDSLKSLIIWFGVHWPGVPIFISETGDDSLGTNSAGWQAVRSVQEALPHEYSNVFIGFDSAQYFYDEDKMYNELHYNYKGYKQMGEALATAIANYSAQRSDGYSLNYYNPKYGWQRLITGIQDYYITNNQDNSNENTFAGDIDIIKNNSVQYIKAGSLHLPIWENTGGVLFTYYTKAGNDAGVQLFFPRGTPPVDSLDHFDIRQNANGIYENWFRVNTSASDSAIFALKSEAFTLDSLYAHSVSVKFPLFTTDTSFEADTSRKPHSLVTQHQIDSLEAAKIGWPDTLTTIPTRYDLAQKIFTVGSTNYTAQVPNWETVDMDTLVGKRFISWANSLSLHRPPYMTQGGTLINNYSKPGDTVTTQLYQGWENNGDMFSWRSKFEDQPWSDWFQAVSTKRLADSAAVLRAAIAAGGGGGGGTDSIMAALAPITIARNGDTIKIGLDTENYLTIPFPDDSVDISSLAGTAPPLDSVLKSGNESTRSITVGGVHVTGGSQFDGYLLIGGSIPGTNGAEITGIGNGTFSALQTPVLNVGGTATMDVMKTGGVGSAIRVVTGNTTITGADYTVILDGASSAVTWTLPAASQVENQIFRIVNWGTTGGTITLSEGIVEGTGNTGNGIAPGGSWTIQSDGTQYWLIQQNNP